MFHKSLKNLLFFGIILSLYDFSLSADPACGINGFPPGHTFILDTLPDSFGPDIEIWRTVTYNVIATSAESHPHFKYISGYRLSKAYYFKTSKDFFLSNFIETEKTDTILRNVTFVCNDESKVQYSFQIPLEMTDRKRPEFLKPSYELKITEDWQLTKSINQGTLIVVGDADVEFLNANLTFGTSHKDTLRVIGIPLWNGDLPSEHFYYRVDLYVEKTLAAGNYEFIVYAYSRFMSGTALITLTVESTV